MARELTTGRRRLAPSSPVALAHAHPRRVFRPPITATCSAAANRCFTRVFPICTFAALPPAARTQASVAATALHAWTTC
eukprot:604677-Pleurochrysis_carterae.AAC.2